MILCACSAGFFVFKVELSVMSQFIANKNVPHYSFTYNQLVIHAKHCYFGIIEIIFRIIFIYRFSILILGKILVVCMFLSCLLFLEVLYIYIDTHTTPNMFD